MLLKLTAQSTDPRQAADIATAVAKAFIDENRRLQLGQAAVSRDSLEKQLQALDNDIRTTSGQLDQLRSSSSGGTPVATQAEIARLQSTLSQDQLNYSQLLKADQDMQLAEAKAYSSVSIAGPAVVPVIPVSPKTAQNVLLAALVGLMLAVGVVLLIEYLDDTVKSDETVVGALGVSALGYVSRFKGGRSRGGVSLPGKDPHSPVIEAFRVLRTCAPTWSSPWWIAPATSCW
ncbi:MAG: hypothetical protein M1582_04150 [Actinobacteria bacterium]|nr:hypothetical protein [Actinomycetota bacterium]